MLETKVRIHLVSWLVFAAFLSGCSKTQDVELPVTSNETSSEKQPPNFPKVEIYIVADGLDSVSHSDLSGWTPDSVSLTSSLTATTQDKDELSWTIEFLGALASADQYRVQASFGSEENATFTQTTNTILYRGVDAVFWKDGGQRMGMRPPSRPVNVGMSVTRYGPDNAGETNSESGTAE